MLQNYGIHGSSLSLIIKPSRQKVLKIMRTIKTKVENRYISKDPK